MNGWQLLFATPIVVAVYIALRIWIAPLDGLARDETPEEEEL